MSATLSKLRTSWVGRALLAYAVSALALVVLDLAAPGSAVFFPLVSLWCNLALFGLVLVVLRLADVKFDLFHWAVIIGFWAAALLYFYWAETRRSFVYIWDYVNYINKQYNAEAAFLQGPAVGFHFILDSLAEDYTNFNTLFLEFPFCLTDRTGDSFAICQVFSIVPMLLLLLAGLVVKVGQMLQVKNRFWYFLIGLSWTFTYPWLRMSAVLSQPDWFGLIFAFSILLLTLDFRFEKLDLPRFGLLLLLCLRRAGAGEQRPHCQSGPQAGCPAAGAQPDPVRPDVHGGHGHPAVAPGEPHSGLRLRRPLFLLQRRRHGH